MHTTGSARANAGRGLMVITMPGARALDHLSGALGKLLLREVFVPFDPRDYRRQQLLDVSARGHDQGNIDLR
jgi:hypothetical protein